MIGVACTVRHGASQLDTGTIFLEVKGFFEPNLQGFSRVRGGSIRDASDVVIHEINRLWVFEVFYQEFTLHLHNLDLAG